MADSTALTHAYLAAYHEAGKNLLPGSFHQMLHDTAMPKSGGRSSPKKITPSSGAIPGGGFGMVSKMPSVPADMVTNPGQAMMKADTSDPGDSGDTAPDSADTAPCMVAWFPPADVANALHPGEVEGAQSQDIGNMHMTLLFMGDLGPDDVETLIEAVKDFAAQQEALPANVSGVGRFIAKADAPISTAPGNPVAYASVDSAGLPAMRQALLDHVTSYGLAPVQDHGFTPHISLAALGADSPTGGPWDDLEPMDMTIDHLAVASGGERHIFPLQEPASDAAAIAKGERVPYELYVPICKAETARRIVTGLVLVPGQVDQQGDQITAEEIELTAHRFLRDYNRMGVLHKAQVDGITVVESYTAPCDMELDTMDGGKMPVPFGSWVLSAHVAPDDAWTAVEKRELTGFSMEGYFTGTPVFTG
jgi:2'-5' RNA ligase